jgi:hypothetical protein
MSEVKTTPKVLVVIGGASQTVKGCPTDSCLYVKATDTGYLYGVKNGDFRLCGEPYIQPTSGITTVIIDWNSWYTMPEPQVVTMILEKLGALYPQLSEEIPLLEIAMRH